MPEGLVTKTKDAEQIQTTQNDQQEDWLDAVHAMFTNAETERKIKEDRRRDEREELTILQLQQQYPVQVPTTTIRGNTFGESYKEHIGAKKRSMRSKMYGSRLRQKRIDAAAVKEAAEKWEQVLQDRQHRFIASQEAYDLADLQVLSVYLTEDAQENQVLFPEHAEHHTLTSKQVNYCIRRFMDLDISADFRNDTTVASESVRLEEMTAKTNAIKCLLRRYPEMLKRLPYDEAADLKLKIDAAEQVTSYYQMQKKVMTNQYYQTHYNSELSYKYQEGDTLEQKNLTIMLWQAERLRTREQVAGNREYNEWYHGYRLPMTAQEMQYTDQTRDLLSRNRSEIEYGKTSGAIEDSRHADYFRAHNQEGDPIYEGLRNIYYITGFQDFDMNDAFCRFMATMPRFKVIQHMPREQLEVMMDAMCQRPADPIDVQEIEACKQANILGLRLFKEQLYKQMKYLKRKYGNGMYLISPQEIADHNAEFVNDFTNMQTMGSFITFIKKLPKEFGLFDDANEEDQELSRLVYYYQSCSFSEGSTRNFFCGDTYSYSQYKKNVACQGILLNHVENELIEMTDQMHLDIRWDTLFDEQDVEFDELTRFIKYKPMAECREEAGSARPTWNQLLPETKQMSRKEAALHFLQKEFQVTEEKKQQWRQEGLDFGSINYFGVGTDDFPVINKIYRDILGSEELQREHGITSPEALEELREHVRLNGEMQVFDKTELGYSLAAANMLDRLDTVRSKAGGDTGALLDQLSDDLNDLMMEHHQRASEYRNTEGDQIFNNFTRFKEAQDLWLYPPHKEIMKQVIEPEILKQQTDTTVTVSGLTIPTFKENYGSEEEAVMLRDLPTMLKDRRLKEGVDPSAFADTLQKYNQEFARERVLVRMRNAFSQDVLSPEKFEPLWNEVPNKRTLFQHDICGRHRICDERKEELYHQLEQMTEQIPKTAEPQT